MYVCVSWQARGLNMFAGDLRYLVTPVLDIEERPFPPDFHVIASVKYALHVPLLVCM